jgi:cytochrome b561
VVANETRAYGATSRALHWITVLALGTQLTIGYAMDTDDSGHGRGHSGGHGGGDGRDRGAGSGSGGGHASQHGSRHGGGDDDSLLGHGWDLVATHVALGLVILLLGVVRVVWRRASGLPPWARALSAGDRRLMVLVERTLLSLLFVIPATGLALVLGDDDWLALHVAAHIAFFVALTIHVGIVLRRGLLPRMV